MTKAFTTTGEKSGIRSQDAFVSINPSPTKSRIIDHRPETLVQRKLYQMANHYADRSLPIQKKSALKEEELLQGKFKITQRKKTAPHEGFETGGHHALIHTHPALGLLERGSPQDVKDRRIFDIVEIEYIKSVKKGRLNWANLHASLMRYQNHREELVYELETKRAQYQLRWQQQYQTKLTKGIGEGVLASTHGRLVKDEVTADGPASRGYNNTMYPESNTISAEANYANDDPARLADRGINNSEILWQQYLMAVRTKNNIYEDPESRTTEKMKELSNLVRKNLQNPVVQKVVYFCYPNGQYWNFEMHWTPHDEEFYALLGTPNVAAAIFLLIDHMDELGGKTIERIETTADQNINIIFGQAPDIQKIEHTLLTFSPTLWRQFAFPPTDLGRENPLM